MFEGMVLESGVRLYCSVKICPACYQEYDGDRGHICPGRSINATGGHPIYSAPPVVAPSPRPGKSGEDIYEETLDMRFHVEKPEDPNIGKIIADRYCIRSLVGRGGMGMVY